MIDLPKRTAKPRTYGLTCLTDTGITIAEARAMVEDYGDYVDVVKLGVGSAYVTPRLKEKVELYQNAGIIVYFGGTLFEKFYSQDKLTDYFSYLEQNGIDTIELSSGTIDIPIGDMVGLVKKAKERFRVFCEVGCKDKDFIMAPSAWIGSIRDCLEAGADYAITEGRDSATAGIFRPSGEMRTGLIEEISNAFDSKRIVFEAPTQPSQMIFINQFGPNVNLGNVNPRDVLILEAQRQSLRYETFGNQ